MSVSRKDEGGARSPWLVADEAGLKKLCGILRHAPQIALDTEFVPEKTFHPVLCLVQVATEDTLALVDALALADLSPLWEAICRRGCEVVVHAGRAEMEFCLSRGGRLPGRVVDVQLLAGFLGLGHPLSHSKLVREVLGVDTHSSQTRTDWRKRPLTDDQLRYAAEDVEHLFQIRDALMRRCRKMGRLEWFWEETQRGLEALSEQEEPWLRISGAGGLEGRQLAALAALARWREERASQLDRPRKHVLADDALVELARLQPTDAASLGKSRQLAHLAKTRWADEIFDAITGARALPRDQWPRRAPRSPHALARGDLLVKILGAALSQIAEDCLLAPALLGTQEDIGDLVEWRRGGDKGEPPRLMRGWRARICGRPLLELMEGRLLIGVEPAGQGSRLFFAPDPNVRARLGKLPDDVQ